MQLGITVSGALDAARLREAVHTAVKRHPNLVARFSEDFGEPVQVIPADPDMAWRYVELDGGDVDEQVERLCADERAAVCDLADKPSFRAALFRTAPDRHRFVLTIHHIVVDGWSLPVLLQEVFASYYGERLPAAASYRSFVTWLTNQDRAAAQAAWAAGAGRFRDAHPGRSPRPGRAARRCRLPRARRDHAGAGRAGPLVPHHDQHRAAGRVDAAADVDDRPA